MELNKFLLICIFIGINIKVDAQNINSISNNNNDITLSKSTAFFAAKMIKQLSNENPDENILISPISIQLIMGLLKLGAEGLTAQELSDVLVLPEDNEILKDHLFKLQRNFKRWDLSPSREPNITMANLIYVRRNVNVSAAFYKTAKDYLNVDVRPLEPFNSNATIVEEINERISKETNGQISDVLQESDVTFDTVMLLINTLHFKGKWRDNGFNISETKMETFFSDNLRFTEVPMMRQTDHFYVGRYARFNVTYLELPYSGRDIDDTGDYVFAIYLPDISKNGTVRTISAETAEYLLTHKPEITNNEQVDVRIPRFKIKSNNKLKAIMEKLGLRHVFNNAELPHLTADKKSVQVTDVYHNTALDVSEEGTEASAATVVGIDDRIFTQPLPFNANRPFLYVLKQKSTDIILFVGHYKNVKE